MATKNDITGDSIISKTNTDKYRDGFAAIFGRPPLKECERCGKLTDGVHTCAPKENKE